jgi:hypothetical protein
VSEAYRDFWHHRVHVSFPFPKDLSHCDTLVAFIVWCLFRVSDSASCIPQAWEPPLFDCPRLTVQYFHSHLSSVFSTAVFYFHFSVTFDRSIFDLCKMFTELYKTEGLTTMNIKTMWGIFNKLQGVTFEKHLVLIQRVTLEMGLGMYVNLAVNLRCLLHFAGFN